MSLTKLYQDIKALASTERAKANTWFFKTGKGEYGEGDVFVGLRVPEVRLIAKKYKDLPLNDIEKLLLSKIHEQRLLGLILLVNKFKQADDTGKQEIYDFYLAHTDRINNWDLVDCSAGYIVGAYLHDKPKAILSHLARSGSLWERRIAMIATQHFINNGESKDALKIAEMLINDKHDLIQKAVGWMLREIGKRCGRAVEEKFLVKYYKTMPKTALRYAIEHFPEKLRQRYLKGLPVSS